MVFSTLLVAITHIYVATRIQGGIWYILSEKHTDQCVDSFTTCAQCLTTVPAVAMFPKASLRRTIVQQFYCAASRSW